MGSTHKKAAMIEVSLPPPRILIVDDDLRFLEGAQEFFSSHGYEVDIAHTPDEAAQILKGGRGKYQLVAVDVNFGDLSETRGDEFVLQNKSLFDEAKVVIFTGAGSSTTSRRHELEREGISLLEKSPGLTKTLELITKEESQKWADHITMFVTKEAVPRIEHLTGQQFGVKVSSDAEPRYGLSDLVMQKLKLTLVKWLESRSDPREPIIFYDDRVYSANDLAEEVSNETEVGLEHIRMLISEFEHSLSI